MHLPLIAAAPIFAKPVSYRSRVQLQQLSVLKVIPCDWRLRNISRMDTGFRKASALRNRSSNSLASLRHNPIMRLDRESSLFAVFPASYPHRSTHPHFPGLRRSGHQYHRYGFSTPSALCAGRLPVIKMSPGAKVRMRTCRT